MPEATVVEAQSPSNERRERSRSTGARLRKLAARLTTPLLPDDYLHLVNPLWSTRELRGRVESVVQQTDDAATLVLRPGWGWTFDHLAGQYLGIGVELEGRWHWRSYSLTSAPTGTADLLEITVKAMPEGFLSGHLVHGLEPGTVVRLAPPQGGFVLPEPPPAKILFLTAGSGVTPILGMLRTLDRRDRMPDVVLVQSAPDQEQMLFRSEMRDLAERHPLLHLVQRFTTTEGRLSFEDDSDITSACPDWRERETWACGPEAMLTAVETLWDRHGLGDRLHLERFTTTLTGGGESGEVTFARSGISTSVDGATTLLDAGEQAGALMPFGCRMGICHTCVVPLLEGSVRDLRTGAEQTGRDTPVQTCVSAAVGDCVLDV